MVCYSVNSQQNQSENKVKQAGNYYKNLIPKLFGKYPGWSLLKKLIAWWVGMSRPMVREVGETEVRISVHKSAALASMTFMLGMKAAGYDTCPMEGTDTWRIKKLLKLPRGAEITMIVSCGIRKPEGVYGERFRIPFEAIYRKF